MRVTMKEIPGFRVAGLTMPMTSNLDISSLWQQLDQVTGESLAAQAGSGQYFGVCYGFAQGTPRYMAGFDWKKERTSLPENFQILDIPANLYALVEIEGPIEPTIKQGFDWFMTNYLPTTDLELTGDPSFEVYSSGDMYAPDYRMELWIPIRNKA